MGRIRNLLPPKGLRMDQQKRNLCLLTGRGICTCALELCHKELKHVRVLWSMLQNTQKTSCLPLLSRERENVENTRQLYLVQASVSCEKKNKLGFPWSSFISLPQPLSRKNVSLWNEEGVTGILCRSPNPSYHTFVIFFFFTFIILNLFYSPEIKENRWATWFFAYRKRTLSNETQLITSLQILTSLDSFLSIKQIHFCFPGGLNYLSALGLFWILTSSLWQEVWHKELKVEEMDLGSWFCRVHPSQQEGMEKELTLCQTGRRESEI